MPRDFDDNEFPLAYLITIRSYGTWLHGDERGSVDRRHNAYGTSRIPPNPGLKKSDRRQLAHPPVLLDVRRRMVIENAVREVCANRHYTLHAFNVRTNHVHTVVTAASKPEPVREAFKAYATRALRKKGLLSRVSRTWVRGGSRRYLWKEWDVKEAVDYVLFGQGNELFRLDEDE